MKNINYAIDQEDLKVLFIKSGFSLGNQTLENFVKDCESGYQSYFKRNSENLEKYGEPKTFSQWINGQIIALD